MRQCVALMKLKEAVDEVLCGRIMDNYSEFIEGMTQVSELQHDLTMAHVVVKNGRRFTRRAVDGVEGALEVVANSKRKERLLQTLRLAEEIREALAAREALRGLLGERQYARAMAGAIELREALGELAERGGEGSGIQALREAQSNIDEIASEAVSQADEQLQKQCETFDPAAYRDVLYVYMLLEDELGLCDKVATFAQQNVLRRSQATLARFAAVAEAAGAKPGSSRQVPFVELCRSVPADQFLECLRATMCALFEVLCSYHGMLAWHLRAVSKAPPATDPVAENAASEAEAEAAAAAAAAAAHERDTCAVIAAALKRGRRTVWDLAARRVAALLSSDSLATSGSESYMQVVEWTSSFIAAGEAFCGSEAGALRQRLQHQTLKYFGAQHKRSMGVLKDMLNKEAWQPLPVEALEAYHRSARAQVPASAERLKAATTVKQGDFEVFVSEGVERLFSSASAGGSSNGGAQDGDVSGGSAPTTPAASGGGAVAEQDSKQAPGSDAAADKAGQDAPTLTAAALRIGTSWKRYAELMELLPPIAPQIFRGASEMYELYMLSIFQLFGKREALAMELSANTSDAQAMLTPRLRTALLRIAKERGINVTHWRPVRRAAEDNGGSAAAAEAAVAPPVAEKKSSGGMMSKLGARFDKLSDKLSARTPPKLSRTASASSSGGGGGGAHAVALPRMQTALEARQGQPVSPGAPPTPEAIADASARSRMEAILSSGNMYGLKESSIATESLAWVAGEVKGMRQRLVAQLPPGDGKAAGQFFSRTVEAADDLREHVLKSVSRLLLNSAAFAHALAGARFDAREVGDRHSAYVDVILNSFRQFSTKVSVAGVTGGVANVMFDDAIAATAEALVQGFAQHRKCTNEGRALMSLDLQTLSVGLRELRHGELPPNLDLVAEYIRAFYLPQEDVLGWAARHPEYTITQVVALIKSAADSQGWKRKDRNAIIERVEAGDLI